MGSVAKGSGNSSHPHPKPTVGVRICGFILNRRQEVHASLNRPDWGVTSPNMVLASVSPTRGSNQSSELDDISPYMSSSSGRHLSSALSFFPSVRFLGKVNFSESTVSVG